MTRNSGASLNRRCQYQAVAMKMLEPANTGIGRYAEKGCGNMETPLYKWALTGELHGSE